MPHAKVTFDASKTKPWSISSDDIDVEVSTMVSEVDQEGFPLIFHHTVSLINKTRPELLDKKFKLKIASSQFKEVASKANKFRWWDPHIDLGITNAVAFSDPPYYAPGIDLGLSVITYGQTSHNNLLKILRVGIGMNVTEEGYDGYLILEPVKYNIGSALPLVSSLYVGGGPTYSFDQHWGIGITLGTTL